MNTNTGLNIRQLIESALDEIEKPKWRAHQRNAAKCGFLRFLEEKRPELKQWAQLVPGHIKEFSKWLTNERDPNIKPWTAHNYLNPLRLAQRHVQFYYPDLHRNLFVRNIAPKITPSAKRYLMTDQLAAAIAHAKQANDTGALCGLVFGGLAGLRLEEIASLQAADVETDGINIRRQKVEGMPARFIPLPTPAMDFAKAWAKLYSRCPLQTIEAMSHRIRKILDRCAVDTGEREFTMTDAHQATRVTFTNIALHAGVDTKYLDAYMGHAPQGVFEKHYADLVPSIHDMPRLQKEKVLQMRKRVIEPIDKKLFGLSF
jgi:integrase